MNRRGLAGASTAILVQKLKQHLGVLLPLTTFHVLLSITPSLDLVWVAGSRVQLHWRLQSWMRPLSRVRHCSRWPAMRRCMIGWLVKWVDHKHRAITRWGGWITEATTRYCQGSLAGSLSPGTRNQLCKHMPCILGTLQHAARIWLHIAAIKYQSCTQPRGCTCSTARRLYLTFE